MSSPASAPPGAADEPIDTLDEVLAELAERRIEFREQRFVSRDFVARLKECGIYRAATPTRFGGEPLPPTAFLDRIERISAVDGSTGWVASFGAGLVYLAALPLETQAQLYSNGPDLVFAGGLFPVQPAAETATGFRVNGRWKFASGCMGADFLGVGIPGEEPGTVRTAVLRPGDVEVVQDWDVVGMRGTGSFDLVVRDVDVPADWTFVRGGQPTVDEPLYRYPSIAYAAQVLAVVGAGIARAAVDYAVEVGAGYAGVTGAPKLADRAYYRHAVASAVADLRSARAWFYDASDEAWQQVLRGDPIPEDQHALLRLSAAHLAKTSSSVVSRLVEVSGTSPIYTEHPLQALLADALVPKQHAFLGPAQYDAAGAVLMGLPPTTRGFR